MFFQMGGFSTQDAVWNEVDILSYLDCQERPIHHIYKSLADGEFFREYRHRSKISVSISSQISYSIFFIFNAFITKNNIDMRICLQEIFYFL